MSTPHAAFRHFPLNAWYAAAWDHEVGRNLLAKTIAGRPIVFYRTTDGRPVALADATYRQTLGTFVPDDGSLGPLTRRPARDEGRQGRPVAAGRGTGEWT